MANAGQSCPFPSRSRTNGFAVWSRGPSTRQTHAGLWGPARHSCRKAPSSSLSANPTCCEVPAQPRFWEQPASTPRPETPELVPRPSAQNQPRVPWGTRGEGEEERGEGKRCWANGQTRLSDRRTKRWEARQVPALGGTRLCSPALTTRTRRLEIGASLVPLPGSRHLDGAPQVGFQAHPEQIHPFPGIQASAAIKEPSRSRICLWGGSGLNGGRTQAHPSQRTGLCLRNPSTQKHQILLTGSNCCRAENKLLGHRNPQKQTPKLPPPYTDTEMRRAWKRACISSRSTKNPKY